MKLIAFIVLVVLVATPQATAGDMGVAPVAKKTKTVKRTESKAAWHCPSARRALTYYRLRKTNWLTLRGVDWKVPIEQPRGCSLVRWKVEQSQRDLRAAKRAYVRYLKQFTYRGSNPNVRLGQRMAAAYGWHLGHEWDALYELWNHESGWDHTAVGPQTVHGRACGIPQSMGNCHGYDPQSQIAWGLSYIKGRYGSPTGAYAHFRARDWY